MFLRRRVERAGRVIGGRGEARCRNGFTNVCAVVAASGFVIVCTGPTDFTTPAAGFATTRTDLFCAASVRVLAALRAAAAAAALRAAAAALLRAFCVSMRFLLRFSASALSSAFSSANLFAAFFSSSIRSLCWL